MRGQGPSSPSRQRAPPAALQARHPTEGQVTHGRGPVLHHCCPGSHCLRHTSIAPGCSDCWHRQTRPAGTGVGARRTGSLWAPQGYERESQSQVMGQVLSLLVLLFKNNIHKVIFFLAHTSS